MVTVRLRVRRGSTSGRATALDASIYHPGVMTVTDDQTGYAQRLHEAADPATSPWRLAALADAPDPDVRMTVATNPSASALTILHLRHDTDPQVRAVLPERYGMGA